MHRLLQSNQYKRKSALNAHTNSEHKGITYKCNQCDKEFTHSSNRSKHIKSVHQKTKYSCSLCAYQATVPGTLRTHQKSVHEGVKLPCPICGLKLQQRSLKAHIESQHKERKKYQCKSCDKQYKNLKVLKQHTNRLFNIPNLYIVRNGWQLKMSIKTEWPEYLCCASYSASIIIT